MSYMSIYPVICHYIHISCYMGLYSIIFHHMLLNPHLGLHWPCKHVPWQSKTSLRVVGHNLISGLLNTLQVWPGLAKLEGKHSRLYGMSLSDIICPSMSLYAIICGTNPTKVSILCTKTANFGRVYPGLVKPGSLATTTFVSCWTLFKFGLV